jgi:hypothetical protein
VAFDGDTQPGLLRLIAILQGAADLRQDLIGQLQQDLSLRRKAQRLTFTYKQTEAEALFQIAELVGQGGLGLVQGRRAPAREPLFRNAWSVFRCLISIMKVLHFGMNNLRLRNIQ